MCASPTEYLLRSSSWAWRSLDGAAFVNCAQALADSFDRQGQGRTPPGHVGDGSNRWPAVPRLDSARLFRLALEKAPAGSTLHAVADEGVPIHDVAAVIGRHPHLPVVFISPEDVGEHFGWLEAFIGIDSPASSALTRELLGWQPTYPGLIDDLDQGHYFRNPSAGPPHPNEIGALRPDPARLTTMMWGTTHQGGPPPRCT